MTLLVALKGKAGLAGWQEDVDLHRPYIDGVTYLGNASANSKMVGANTSTSPKTYSVCVTASNAGGQSQPACAPVTQAAALPLAPVCSSVTLTPNSLPSGGGLVSGQANCTGSGLI